MMPPDIRLDFQKRSTVLGKSDVILKNKLSLFRYKYFCLVVIVVVVLIFEYFQKYMY